MMIPLCCYFLVYFFLGKINLWIRQRPRKSESENVCGGDNNNDRRYIYITLVALKEIDRRRRWEEEVETCVLHSDNYPVYKYFLLLRLFFFSFFFLGINLCFVFCVLCFVCVLWLERETETENTTYIQERLKRRKYVMSNFLV